MAKTSVYRTKKRRRMESAVTYLQQYMATYDKQPGYQDYRDEMLINDVLYGLGAALGSEYQFADGFERFKARLLAILSVPPR